MVLEIILKLRFRHENKGITETLHRNSRRSLDATLDAQRENAYISTYKLQLKPKEQLEAANFWI